MRLGMQLVSTSRPPASRRGAVLCVGTFRPGRIQIRACSSNEPVPPRRRRQAARAGAYRSGCFWLTGSLRLALAVCAALASASAATLLWAQSFALLLFIAMVQAASLAPTTSLADALSVNAARPRSTGKEFEYGWIRGSASLAFIVGTLAVGQLISRTDVTPIISLKGIR
jgi:MFS family permease